MENGNRYVSSVAITCAPQVDSRDATGLDRWTSFLQLYEPFIASELTQQHPQFARALRQLERDSHLEQERQSGQVLATLRVKDTRISELQKVVSEQQEQLDVVLDELERRETKEDKGMQVGEERQKEDASVQTESVRREIETQTEKVERESGALVLLEKLEKELKTLEDKNLILERELQQRVLKSEEDVTKDSEDMKNCLEILQQGVNAMELSCGCVDNPLTFFVGQRDKIDGKESVMMSTCVNLEHRLEAQAIRLEHVQECLYLWRDAAVQMMKRKNEPNCAARPTFSPPLTILRDEKTDSGEMNCSFALRGALSQLRQNVFQLRGKGCNDWPYDLKELAILLTKGKNGAKMAAKMVQKWAGWEAKHLEEVRALRQGFNEELAVARSRRTVLLKRISQLEQRELDIQVEANALKKAIKCQGGLDTRPPSTSSPDNELNREVNKCGGLLEYPQLALRLVTAEQSLLAKDEELTAANDTIRALSSCVPTSTHALSSSTLRSRNDASMNRLAVELQRASKQKLEFFQKREKDLVSLGQYFQMEKLCFQLQSRLEAEQKRAAITKAAINVCERERDELLMKVEKLETEVIVAKLTRRSVTPSLLVGPHIDSKRRESDEYHDALFFAIRRVQLLEDNRQTLRERLRHSQQEVAVMKQQRPHNALHVEKTVKEQKAMPSVFDCIAEHNQKCVGVLKEFLDRQSSDKDLTGANDTAIQPRAELGVLLNHYDVLWIAFNILYSFITELSPFIQTNEVSSDLGARYSSILRTFGCQTSAENYSYDDKQDHLESLQFELFKQSEKELLLQEKLMDLEERFHGYRPIRFNKEADCLSDQNYQNVDRPINFAEFDSGHISGPVELLDKTETNKLFGTPFLASLKLHETPLEHDSISSNGSGGESTLKHGPGSAIVAEAMANCEITGDTATELKECLAKCAYLSSQNTKLTRRLCAEKEANKQHLKEQEGLRAQLSAKMEVKKCKQQQTLEQYQDSKSHAISAGDKSSTAVLQSEEKKKNAAANVTIVSSPQTHEYGQEYELLKDLLTSREQENLALVQSLCSIKEKCAQMEVIHQKELRVKAAEQAEGMESYMTTVNGTLSRIESDKSRLEEENIRLRSKLQQLEEEIMRKKLEQSHRSTKSTNTDCETQNITHKQEKDTLKARIQDLELQLARERKLAEVVEQKKCLEHQQESQANIEASKALQDYETRCKVLQEWRSKLEHEFADYQAIQRASQQESDRRIEFLSACIEEYVRLVDATSSNVGKTISTNELYDAVMALARDPPRTTARAMDSSLQNKMQAKQSLSASQRRSHQCVTFSRDDSWDDILKNEDKARSEPEISELMWWKLRASKMESYMRSATLQNDTFEDTIRQLELGLSNVKQELSSRLAREVQLVSNLATLKAELATTKEQAAALAEKYQLASTELGKYQGEVTSHGDETQRARMAVQRKTELLAQQKLKVASLQQELEQATKKVERLIAAEKQATLLQQKAKEHTQQLLHARQSYERCCDDNVQLSIHLENLKERHAGVVSRLKVARAENANLRAQCVEFKKSTSNVDAKETTIDGYDKNNHRSNQKEANIVSAASLTEEARTLKRRLLQKQDMIVSYKAKVREYEEQLERQRETMVKLARTNRELQQGQFQRHQQELEHRSAIHARLESQFEMKREQLDGLRASVYDSFEVFVYCRAASKSGSQSFTTSAESPLADEIPEDDRIFEIKRWTDFSAQDLEELRLTQGSHLLRHERKNIQNNNVVKQKAARAALREVESALETNPEDCRAEICELLQCLCG